VVEKELLNKSITRFSDWFIFYLGYIF